MWEDPIVAEIRRIREEYAARFNYDIQAICRAAREQETKNGKMVVSRPAKSIARQPAMLQSPSTVGE